MHHKPKKLHYHDQHTSVPATAVYCYQKQGLHHHCNWHFSLTPQDVHWFYYEPSHFPSQNWSLYQPVLQPDPLWVIPETKKDYLSTFQHNNFASHKPNHVRQKQNTASSFMAVLSTTVVPVWSFGCSPQEDPVQCNNHSVSLSLPFGTRMQCLGCSPENWKLNVGYTRQAITGCCTPVMFGILSILLHVTIQ